MKQKTKDIITEVIRWIAFLPVVCICILIGFNIGARLFAYSHLPYIVMRLIMLVIVFACVRPGVRLLMPKNKKLATILAVIITCVLAALYIALEIYIFTHGK